MKESDSNPPAPPFVIPPSFPPNTLNNQNPPHFALFPPHLNLPIPPHPPLYIPPSFPPPNINQMSMPPSFNANGNQSPFLPNDIPISNGYQSNLNRAIPRELSLPPSQTFPTQPPLYIPPSYIPPSFHPSELEQYNPPRPIIRTFPHGRRYIPPQIRVGPLINSHNNNNNKNISGLLEDIEITEQILNKDDSKSCTICLEDYDIGEKICYLPCFHYFHSECIKDWTKKSDKCPVCKMVIKFE